MYAWQTCTNIRIWQCTDTNHDVHMADMYNRKDLAVDSSYGNNDTNHDVHVADMYKHKGLAVDGLYGKT